MNTKSYYSTACTAMLCKVFCALGGHKRVVTYVPLHTELRIHKPIYTELYVWIWCIRYDRFFTKIFLNPNINSNPILKNVNVKLRQLYYSMIYESVLMSAFSLTYFLIQMKTL